jgi:hypothetical protein
MAKLRRKMTSVTLIGRRWFNRGPGNTYHSVEIYLDGKHVHKIPFAYGYGEQWEWNGWEWLEANGYTPGREHHANGSAEPPWAYCQRLGIQYVLNVSDVPRRKDL